MGMEENSKYMCKKELILQQNHNTFINTISISWSTEESAISPRFARHYDTQMLPAIANIFMSINNYRKLPT